MKLNNTDKEILTILKAVFGSSRNIVDPDDLLKSLMLKVMLLFSFLGFCTVVYFDITNNKALGILADIIAGIVALFFLSLTLYINAKSKNSSLFIWLLTMLSMFLGYYLGGA